MKELLRQRLYGASDGDSGDTRTNQMHSLNFKMFNYATYDFTITCVSVSKFSR